MPIAAKKKAKQKAAKRPAAHKKAAPLGGGHAARSSAVTSADARDQPSLPSTAVTLPTQMARLRAMPMEDLVRGSDLASTFLDRAAAVIRDKARRVAPVAAQPAPSVLAEADAQLVSTIAADERLRARVSELEAEVVVTLAPQTRSGERLKALRGRIQEFELDDLRPAGNATEQAAEFARKEGLRVLSVGRFGVTVAGSARQLAAMLKVRLAVNALPRRPIDRATHMFAAAFEPPHASDLFVCPRTSLTVDAAPLHPRLHDVVFLPPPLLFAPPPVAPAVSYAFLDGAGLRRVLQVPNGGDAPLTGQGIRAAIVDTGFDTAHPFYAKGGFDFKAVSFDAGEGAHIDRHGHGTAVSWNVLTVAPGITLRGYKHANPGPAIEKAADDGAQVISCSWGYDHEQVFPLLELTIRSVVEDDGVVVVFAAGNGQRAWPGTMPSVLSVGGIYADPANVAPLRASDYTSGFRSDIYAERTVPDVCGLCGMAPRAIYLPMPVPSGCDMDRSFAGRPFPGADETSNTDGWVFASGTSSAAPQVAGVVALLLEQAARDGKVLSPADVKRVLQASAVPVTNGRNAFGFLAQGHPNVAVGWGLVNAAAALQTPERQGGPEPFSLVAR